MPVPTIFTRFLAALDVPHTKSYANNAFRHMVFNSLYGLSHLLTEYGIPNTGIRVANKEEIVNFTPPFLAQTKSGIFVIVDAIDKAKNEIVYDSRGERQETDLKSFINAWNGIALLAFPTRDSKEPEYGAHKLTEIIQNSSKYALALSALVVFAYFFITRGVYSHISTVLLTLFNCIGLYFSFLLVQKSLNIHTAASDRVCGVLEQGGCDSIMQLKVSKLFGVFSWSEVGFSYFSISLIALLLFPHIWPSLALCNICCLPYTVWSIWYQKFKARHWCTLCVGVQSTLWLLFFSYLGGGWLGQAWPPHLHFFILIAVYLFTVLFINMLVTIFKNLPCHEEHSKA